MKASLFYMLEQYLPDYDEITDIIKGTDKFRVVEIDVCSEKEMYIIEAYMMFSLFISSRDISPCKKIQKFYNAIKHILDGNEHLVLMKESFSEYGFKMSGSMLYNAEVEIYIMDIDNSHNIFREIMRNYKILCSGVRPMLTVDVNMTKIRKHNFENALEVARIVK